MRQAKKAAAMAKTQHEAINKRKEESIIIEEKRKQA